jgi:hypothetical protein
MKNAHASFHAKTAERTTLKRSQGEQMFRVAGVTSHSQKTMLKTAAFEVLLELLANVIWQYIKVETLAGI